jgi:hypothetical protein
MTNNAEIVSAIENDAVLMDSARRLSTSESALRLDFSWCYPTGGGYEKIFGP